MRYTILAAASLFAAALAAPEVTLSKKVKRQAAAPACLSDADAQALADGFGSLIGDYSDEVAVATLVEDFTDWSDSVNTLIDGGCTDGPVPLGVPTFTDRAGFQAGQGAQPPIPFELLNVWHNCDTVIFRWRTALNPQEVTGNIVLEATTKEGPWKVETAYSEFNTGAWLVDNGLFTPTCPAPPPAAKFLRA